MIRLVPDIVAPVGVAAVDLITEATKPSWTKWADYAMTVIGLGAAFMDKGGDTVKNIGIASLPLSVKQIYNQVKGVSASPGTPVGNRVTYRTGKMAAKPEFANTVLY